MVFSFDFMALFVARTREASEIDDQRHPPHVPVPRWPPGPARPGYVPYRLFIIMELITRVSQLQQPNLYSVLVKKCWRVVQVTTTHHMRRLFLLQLPLFAAISLRGNALFPKPPLPRIILHAHWISTSIHATSLVLAIVNVLG